MSDERVAWLREQIDEDERVAQAARHGVSGRWVRPQTDEVRGQGGVVFGSGEDDWPEWSGNGVVVYDEGAPTPEQAVHIARHDPARVLREAEAKRLILAEHEPERETTELDEDGRRVGYEMVCNSCAAVIGQQSYPCPTVRALFPIYADRPGYREEWRS